MWPWEHAALGYVLFSFFVHVTEGRPPAGPSAILLGVATLVPDLVDKPLSWGLHLFPSGYAVAHSVLVAVPVGVLAVVLGRRRQRPLAGLAVLVGYWSHLVGDVVSPLRAGEPLAVDRILWPLVVQDPYARRLGLDRGAYYVVEYLGSVSAGELTGGALLVFLGTLAAIALWVVDGAPGLDVLRRALRVGSRRVRP